MYTMLECKQFNQQPLSQRGDISVTHGPPSRKLAYIILTPLKPHFYMIKLGFTGVYIIFLISTPQHRLWYSSGPPQRVPTIYVLSRNMKNIRDFYVNFFPFLEVKFSIYLNRPVFIMQAQQ